MSFYQVEMHGQRVDVDYTIFRSFSGPRWRNGKPYQGPVYFLGGDEEYTGRIHGICRDCRCNLFLQADWPSEDPRIWEDDNEGYCHDCKP